MNDAPYVLGSENEIPNFEPAYYSILEDQSTPVIFNIIDEDGDTFTLEYLSEPSSGSLQKV